MKKFLGIIFLLFFNTLAVLAETASMEFSLNFPEFLKIETVTSPVLTANITDSTGNLYSPLSSRFRVVSNSSETKTLYLRANTITDDGVEESMFEMNGRVYIAFSHLSNRPKVQALNNCKLGTHPKESPGVVAYPVTSIIGAKHQYQQGKGRYEVYINNGTTDVIVNVGSNVLPNSFSKNDPKGFYQATLLLTEADI